MKEEAQRIAIAEVCRFALTHKKTINRNRIWERDGYLYAICCCPMDNCNFLPNYPNDLNAMHEAEKVLPNASAYIVHLKCVVNKISIENFSWPALGFDAWALSDIVSATAAQRAEAFLRTLNLWTK